MTVRHPAWRLAVATAVAIAIASLSAPGWADVVRLRNGNRIEGEVLEENGREVVIRVPYGVLRIPRRDVASIEREDAAPDPLAEARALERVGDYGGARERAREVLAGDPGAVEAAEMLVRLDVREGDRCLTGRRLAEARSLFRRALDADPENVRAIEGLARLDAIASETAAALEDARGRARAGQYADAVPIYRRVLEIDPSRRLDLGGEIGGVLADAGIQCLRAGDGAAAARHLDAALGYDPALFERVGVPWLVAHITDFGAEVEAGRTGTAVAMLDRVEALDPENPVCRVLRGTLAERAGRADEARRCYRSVVSDAPANLALADLRTRAFEEASRRPLGLRPIDVRAVGAPVSVTTEHFRVEGWNADLAARAARAAEGALTAIAARIPAELRREPAATVLLVIHADRDAYAAAGGPPWSSGITRFEPSADGPRPVIRTFQARGVAEVVVPHEVAHVLFQAVAGEAPLWAEEGFAAWCEPDVMRRGRRDLRATAQSMGRTLPLADLLAARGYPSESSLDLFYAQSYAVAEAAMGRAGVGGFIEALHVLARSGPDAFARSLGFSDLAALDRDLGGEQ